MPNCYYYDEQRNRCNCYANESLNELLAENAKLRELCGELYGFVSRADRMQWPELADRMRELGIEVDDA